MTVKDLLRYEIDIEHYWDNSYCCEIYFGLKIYWLNKTMNPLEIKETGKYSSRIWDDLLCDVIPESIKNYLEEDV